MAIQRNFNDKSQFLPLTTVERVLFYIDPDLLLESSTVNKRKIRIWINSISKAIQSYLDREIILKERTEYFDTVIDNYEYKTNSYPVWSISEVTLDDTVLDSDRYFISSNQDGIVIEDTKLYNEKKALKVVYSAGLAQDATKSIFAISNTFSADNYVLGSNSFALGKITSASSTEVEVSVLNGSFDEGEALVEYSDWDAEITTSASGVITSATQRSLCEMYPDIVNACELQIRYMYQHKDDFENNGTTREGETIRRGSDAIPSLQPEVRMLFDSYRNLQMFA